MDKSSRRIIETSDGSHSIYLPGLNETYHSSHGAITESRHVFIKEGLDYLIAQDGKKEISVFEVGFGTGLNAMLTCVWAETNDIKVHYDSIEAEPLNEGITVSLNHGRAMNIDDIFDQLHKAKWGESVSVTDNFQLHKILDSWYDHQLPKHQYNVIFYDAFAPSKQPDMWDKDLLHKCFESLLPGGVLVTYCAQGKFKRDLASLKFTVQTVEGPPGKKEMVRALKVD